MVTRGGPFTLIGETDYTYASTANLNLTVNIENTVGSITIENDDALTSLVEVRLEMWGRSEAILADAVNFTSSIAGGKVIISFDSGVQNWKWGDKDAFYQKLFVKINPDRNNPIRRQMSRLKKLVSGARYLLYFRSHFTSLRSSASSFLSNRKGNFFKTVEASSLSSRELRQEPI